MSEEDEMARLRGTQQWLPMDWVLIDGADLAAQYRGGTLMIRLLARERRRRRVPQREVARRMGVAPPLLSKLETGNHGHDRLRPSEPRLSTILRYARALGLSPVDVQRIFVIVQMAEFDGSESITSLLTERST